MSNLADYYAGQTPSGPSYGETPSYQSGSDIATTPTATPTATATGTPQNAAYSPQLAAAFANYYQGIQTGSIGGLLPRTESEAFMGPESLQPLAPQEPGNVLTGRFGNANQKRVVWLAIIAGVAVLAWWLWRRSK